MTQERFRVICIIEKYVDAENYRDAIEIGKEEIDLANAEWIADKTGEHDG